MSSCSRDRAELAAHGKEVVSHRTTKGIGIHVRMGVNRRRPREVVKNPAAMTPVEQKMLDRPTNSQFFNGIGQNLTVGLSQSFSRNRSIVKSVSARARHA
jgi:hypothetical protein